MQGLLGHAERQEAAAAVQLQQRTTSNAARFGMTVMLLATLFAALRYGAVWEVHLRCAPALGASRGGWASSLLAPLGARALARYGFYSGCVVKELGRWLRAWSAAGVCA